MLINLKQIIFNLETDDTEIFTVGTSIKGGAKNNAVNFPTPNQTIDITNTTNEVVQYLGNLVTKTGNDLTLINENTIRVLNSTIAQAPSPLPPTDKSQFNIVINTTYVSNNLITSVTQNGSNVDVVIDTASLGYSLANTNGVSIIGKFA
jgi:hypothetical protein